MPLARLSPAPTKLSTQSLVGGAGPEAEDEASGAKPRRCRALQSPFAQNGRPIPSPHGCPRRRQSRRCYAGDPLGWVGLIGADCSILGGRLFPLYISIAGTSAFACFAVLFRPLRATWATHCRGCRYALRAAARDRSRTYHPGLREELLTWVPRPGPSR